jgi:hypothetical protein
MFELHDPNYSLKPVHFSVDDIISSKIKEPFPNTSFFWTIVGKAGSGKTSLLVNTMIHKEIYKKAFDKVILVQPKTSRASLNDNIFEGLPDNQIFEKLDFNVVDRIEMIRKDFDKQNETKKKNRNMLLILDDVTASLRDNEDVLIQLTTNRRHLKLSIVLLVQFLMSIPRPIRLQITHITVFKPSNEIEGNIIRDEFANLPSKDFKKLTRFVWRDSHDFLFIDKQSEKYYKNLQQIKNI